MPNLGVTELIIILIIVIAIFGAGKLSSLGGAVGKTVKEFRREVNPEGQEASSAEAKEGTSTGEDEKEN
ncbi:MAG: twin-arginine translocase TatA/TatE family subunit [Anaerolineales bacterium]